MTTLCQFVQGLAPTITGKICKQVITIPGHLLAIRKHAHNISTDIGKNKLLKSPLTQLKVKYMSL